MEMFSDRNESKLENGSGVHLHCGPRETVTSYVKNYIHRTVELWGNLNLKVVSAP